MWRPHYSLHNLSGGEKGMTAFIAPDIFAIITSANQGWLSVWTRVTSRLYVESIYRPTWFCSCCRLVAWWVWRNRRVKGKQKHVYFLTHCTCYNFTAYSARSWAMTLSLTDMYSLIVERHDLCHSLLFRECFIVFVGAEIWTILNQNEEMPQWSNAFVYILTHIDKVIRERAREQQRPACSVWS